MYDEEALQVFVVMPVRMLGSLAMGIFHNLANLDSCRRCQIPKLVRDKNNGKFVNLNPLKVLAKTYQKIA